MVWLLGSVVWFDFVTVLFAVDCYVLMLQLAVVVLIWLLSWVDWFVVGGVEWAVLSGWLICCFSVVYLQVLVTGF